MLRKQWCQSTTWLTWGFQRWIPSQGIVWSVRGQQHLWAVHARWSSIASRAAVGCPSYDTQSQPHIYIGQMYHCCVMSFLWHTITAAYLHRSNVSPLWDVLPMNIQSQLHIYIGQIYHRHGMSFLWHTITAAYLHRSNVSPLWDVLPMTHNHSRIST